MESPHILEKDPGLKAPETRDVRMISFHFDIIRDGQMERAPCLLHQKTGHGSASSLSCKHSLDASAAQASYKAPARSLSR